MPSSSGSEADLGRIRRRFHIATTVLAFGALALIAIVVIGAFMAVDKRAAEAFKAKPGIVHDQKKRISSAGASRMARPPPKAAGSDTAEAQASGLSSMTQQTTSGQAGPAPDAETQHHTLNKGHHGRRRRHRRR